jgi:hypothetical protein
MTPKINRSSWPWKDQHLKFYPPITTTFVNFERSENLYPYLAKAGLLHSRDNNNKKDHCTQAASESCASWAKYFLLFSRSDTHRATRSQQRAAPVTAAVSRLFLLGLTHQQPKPCTNVNQETEYGCNEEHADS